MSSSSKRKYRQNERASARAAVEPERTNRHAVDAALFIEAHEADLVQNQEDVALTLETSHTDQTSEGRRASALVRWSSTGDDSDCSCIDRFDARHLLPDSELSQTWQTAPSRLSPSGWSDLPSDAEDTFFFSAAEVDDFRRDKRRRLLDRNREERFRAMEEDTTRASEDDTWEGSDEEPSDEQRALMHRTATHIHSSPNPGQLEMRILTNHGADKRFAFLRGRWKNAWSREKRKVLEEKEREAAKAAEAPSVGLMGLSGYADSDEEETHHPEGEGQPDEGSHSQEGAGESEAQKKEARRARAREWAAKRRAEMNEGS